MKKPLDEIFFQEPIIKDEINKIKIEKSYKEIEDFTRKYNIDLESLFLIGDIDEKDLSVNYSRAFLESLAQFLGYNFDDLFIDTTF